MTAELARVRAELEAAQRRAHEVTDGLTTRQWTARPRPDDWSVSECFAHLNLTSRAFIPLLDDALGHAPPARERRRARMDRAGWVVWLATTLRIPVKTTEPFVPAGPESGEAVLAEFDELQRRVLDRVARADGLDLGAVRIVSPFDARLRYNVYAAFRLIAAHQRLHLRQAARARARVAAMA